MNQNFPKESRVEVDLGPRTYEIIVGEGLIKKASEYISPFLMGSLVPIVCDSTVAKFHLPLLKKSLKTAGIGCESIIIPAGESSKNFRQLENLIDELLCLKIGRDDLILAFGGGVIGDLVGLAAAILRRGVSYIQIPTTLLAQVDSSVGGKTAINSRFGKNLVGAFHQPKLVLADLSVLETLPNRELKAGYSEVVKYGLLKDASFFDWLEFNGQKLLDGDSTLIRHAIVTSCKIKSEIVALDEREKGLRALLNLGHTFGHAYEAEAANKIDLLHGEAVAVGLIQASKLSQKLGCCPEQDVTRIREHFEKLQLPTSEKALGLNNTPRERLLLHMYQDKKVKTGELTFILLRKIGDAFISHNVANDTILETLQFGS